MSATVYDEAKRLSAALAKLDAREAADLAKVQAKYADARSLLEGVASDAALRIIEAAKDRADGSTS